jgi:hypothetical protein
MTRGVLVALCLAGCGSNNTSTNANAPDTSQPFIEGGTWDDDVSLPDIATDPSLVARVPIDPIAPGTEVQHTIETVLTNDAEVWVGGVDWSSPKGLHHSRLDAPPDFTWHTYPVLALPVGVSEASEVFADGTALKLAPRQPLKISFHYVNAGSTPISGEVFVRFHPLPEGATPQPLSMLWLMNEAIDLPARTKVDLETTCTLPRDLTLYDLVPHTHALGVGVDAYVVGGVNDGKNIYTSTAWSEGPRVRLDPPLALRAGESIRFVCHYENSTDARVVFGDDAASEMCVIAGHFASGTEPIALAVPSTGGPCVPRAGR